VNAATRISSAVSPPPASVAHLLASSQSPRDHDPGSSVRPHDQRGSFAASAPRGCRASCRRRKPRWTTPCSRSQVEARVGSARASPSARREPVTRSGRTRAPATDRPRPPGGGNDSSVPPHKPGRGGPASRPHHYAVRSAAATSRASIGGEGGPRRRSGCPRRAPPLAARPGSAAITRMRPPSRPTCPRGSTR